MKLLIVIFSMLLVGLQAQTGFETLKPNTWKQVLTTGQFPARGFETHLAFDTAGYTYMLGSCAYGGSAAGTHNNEIFRFDNKTGAVVELYACGTNPWPGGCQGAQVYDPKRNCIWFGQGWNAACRTGVLWHPGKAYYSGLYRMQCPSGPLEAIHLDTSVASTFMLMDTANDLLIGIADNNYHGARLNIYDINKKTLTVKTAPAPFSTVVTSKFDVACCFDTKRGLVVFTRWAQKDTATAAKWVWFYNTTTGAWTYKVPAVVPPPINVPLVYEPAADKYVLFGTDPAGRAGTGDPHPQIWAYDYDSNTWTERPRGAMHYDTLNRSGSNWPPLRTYCGSFGYDQKNGVLVNWGGLPLNCAAASDNKFTHPLWAFKLGDPTTSSAPSLKKSAASSTLITATPNPFNPRVTLRLNGKLTSGATVKVFDQGGRLVADLSRPVQNGAVTWNAMGKPAGIYLLSVEKEGFSTRERLVLIK